MPDVQKEQAYNQSLHSFVQYFQTLEENKNAIEEVKSNLEKMKEVD